MKKLIYTAMLLTVAALNAQVRYTGSTLSDVRMPDGGLEPAIGVHNVQTMRALRAHGDWTYNHQPMLAYWQGKFYLHYLSNPVSEHVGAGRTMMQTSTDGYHWTAPQVLFDVYPVPDGYTKDGGQHIASGHMAVMHQRVGWYVASNGKLLATGNYGVALHAKDDPNDGNGIGRVVREVKADGTLGEVYFIYYNHAFNQSNTLHKHYTKSSDKAFVKACDELIANPLQRMQWVEEADRNDPILPLKQPYKAMSWYTLPDGRIAALWKHALTSISADGGNSWSEPVQRAPGFVTSNAKIWGQRLTDGTYATVYNPSEYRWPLAISLSADGEEYTTLNLVQGNIPPVRYAGQYKSTGPQYVRGIQEGNSTPPDSDLWVSYSMGKEDMWVAHIPVPVRTTATHHATNDFSSATTLADLRQWNIHSPLWAPVSITKTDTLSWLTLSDRDPYDAAVAERVIPPTRQLTVDFDLIADNTDGMLQIEMLNSKGTPCARIDITDGKILAKGGARYGNAGAYTPRKPQHIQVVLSTTNRSYTVYIDGRKRSTRMLYSPVDAVSRIIFRTGARSYEPTPDSPADIITDLPRADASDAEAKFMIANFSTASGDASSHTAILRWSDFSHHIDYFNSAEDENIAQAIPNAEASEWLSRNIPLFECPDADFEQMYYYRWWSMRKHLKATSVGWGMTEFLVDRKYADKYNLISCALGHHIYEGRWIRDPQYIDGVINTWYHGNDGDPMPKMMNFSSWTPDAIYNRFLVTGDTATTVKLLPSMVAEYERWQAEYRGSDGLYRQRDVADGMEESISGARKQRHARPTINSYMYGNARAISAVAALAGDSVTACLYTLKADTLRTLIGQRLWCADDSFFETVRGDTCARVREAIGFIPWYFGIPGKQHERAWLQLTDKRGFWAPYGITTAERRHAEFRTHGTGKCEWDGAVWPFATSQTLTALARYLADEREPVLPDSVFYEAMKVYVESMHHRGRPYIGEYLDETTGYWLKGDQERSRYYNHSTFADLVITGIAGLRPRADDEIELHPLAPDSWQWWCIDGIKYHGRNLTILYDRDGTRYHQGRGLKVIVSQSPLAPAP